LATEGKYGAPPEDYKIFKAAQYCNCKPWELVEQSLFWTFKALDYMSAEEEAQKSIADRQR
jgi:hypothetical protein